MQKTRLLKNSKGICRGSCDLRSLQANVGKEKNMRQGKDSGEVRFYFQANKEKKKLTDRLWQTKSFFPLSSFLSPLARPLIAVSSLTLPSVSSSSLLFRGRMDDLCLCHDCTLSLILVREALLCWNFTALCCFVVFCFVNIKKTRIHCIMWMSAFAWLFHSRLCLCSVPLFQWVDMQCHACSCVCLSVAEPVC